VSSQRRQHGTGTLVPRGEKRWLVRVDYGQDPITLRRDRRSVTVTGTKASAQRRMNELLQERDQGSTFRRSDITTGEWLARWLKRHVGDGRIGPRVHERYRSIIKHHLIPTIGSIELQRLRSDQITTLKDAWLSRPSPRTGRPLSAATVYKHLVVLRRALQDAQTEGLIVRNAADSVRRPSATQRAERRALTEQEIELLLQSARGGRFDAPIRFTLATGLREGEMLALCWNDVNFEAASIYVRGTKTAHSRRTIEVSRVTLGLLRSHRQEQRQLRLQLGPAWGERDLVFTSSVGTPWFRRAFYRDYRRVLDRSGIDNPATVNWHTLRHTAASLWIRHGADVFTVSRRLGHASAAFTMDVYAHLLKGQQKVAAEALDHLLAN